MPGNPENLITDKTHFHPKEDDISDLADLLRPEFVEILEHVTQSGNTKQTTEFLVEAVANALREFTFPDEDYAMKIFSTI